MTKKTQRITKGITTLSSKTLSKARSIIGRNMARARWDNMSEEDREKANTHLKNISRLGVEKRKVWKQQRETLNSDATSHN